MLRYRVFAVVACSVLLTVAACDDESLDVDVEEFNANLSGASVVPPVTTSATGTAELTVNGNFLGFRIELSNISGVTAAHLHSGAAGVVLPMSTMATLFTQAAPGTGNVSGLLTQSAVNVPDSVITRLRNGTAYVDVHTTSATSPVIRGQVAPQ